jgi:hypothetical protein
MLVSRGTPRLEVLPTFRYFENEKKKKWEKVKAFSKKKSDQRI